MRFPVQRVLLFTAVSWAVIPAVWAQQQQPRKNGTYANREQRPLQVPSSSQTLTTDERLAILVAALDSRRHTDLRSDCSHFIHALYERAGFPYVYASSSDLYAGVDEFRRVSTPQPGDLVVWRGHAGIVTNPARHSFFSLLRTGAWVDSYDSPYWKRRGHPHFLRYVKDLPIVNASSLHSGD